MSDEKPEKPTNIPIEPDESKIRFMALPLPPPPEPPPPGAVLRHAAWALALVIAVCMAAGVLIAALLNSLSDLGVPQMGWGEGTAIAALTVVLGFLFNWVRR